MLKIAKLKYHLRHWFVPHESNNHRPRILHHQILFLFILFFIISGLLLAPLKSNSGVLGISYSISSSDLLALTNQQRIANGLAPLVMNQDLTNAAQMKAQNMFADNYWAHFAPDGTSPWYWFLKAGYQYNYAGENLARGFTTANDVMNAWMNSPGHRANVLSPNYKDIGFAVMEGNLTGEDTVLVVQEFGSQNSTNEVATVNAPQTTQSVSLSITPSPHSIVNVTPTAQPLVIIQSSVQKSEQQVAAVQSKPLINSASLSKLLAFLIILLLLIALVIDIVIIQRRKVVRLVAHNVDHIIFLVMLLLVLLFIIGKNFIL